MISFTNKKIAILGFGIEAMASYDLLLGIGVDSKNITIVDNQQIDISRIKKDTTLHIGSSGEETFYNTIASYDILRRSPGFSPHNIYIQKNNEKLYSLTQYFFDHYTGKVITVTGTKGKSTTVSLINHVLQHASKKSVVLGNIGKLWTDVIDISKPDTRPEYVVYELSSYMLEGLKKYSYISIITNIGEDHTDWHQGLKNYQSTKCSILDNSVHKVAHISSKDILLSFGYTIDDIIRFGSGSSYTFDNERLYNDIQQKVCARSNIHLPGDHNVENICALVAIASKIGLDTSSIAGGLETFQGLAHRLAIVGVYNGITFIDDAISTTADSTIAGIKSFGQGVQTVFLGGKDRGICFDTLTKYIHGSSIDTIVFFPDAGIRMASEMKDILKGKRILHTSSMQEAVSFAYKHTDIGRICLLSCASPSFSLRKNYIEKGNDFIYWVKKLCTTQ